MNPNNPDENNMGNDGGTGSATLPSTIDFTGSSDNGLSMSDSLSSAQDNLTSAGMAAGDGGNGAIGLDQIGAGDASATMARPDEPLIPAAPVPGSLGSVISGPAILDPQAQYEAEMAEEDPIPETVTPVTDAMIAENGGNPAAMAAPSATPMDGMRFSSVEETVSEVEPEEPVQAEMPADETGQGVDDARQARAGQDEQVGGERDEQFGQAQDGQSAGVGQGDNGGAGANVEPEPARTYDAPAQQVTDAMAAQAVAEVPPQTPYNPFVAPGAVAPAATGATNPFANGAPAMPEVADGGAMGGGAMDALKMRKERFQARSMNLKVLPVSTIVLGIVAAMAVVLAIVFAVLWRQAADSQRIVYLPQAPVEEPVPEPDDEPGEEQPSEPEQEQGGEVSMEEFTLNCRREVGATEVAGVGNVTGVDMLAQMNFVNNSLAKMDVITTYKFENGEAAEATREAFDMMNAVLNMLPEGEETPVMTGGYEVIGEAVRYVMSVDVERAKGVEGMSFDLPEDEEGNVLMDEAAIERYFTEQEYQCAVGAV